MRSVHWFLYWNFQNRNTPTSKICRWLRSFFEQVFLLIWLCYLTWLLVNLLNCRNSSIPSLQLVQQLHICLIFTGSASRSKNESCIFWCFYIHPIPQPLLYFAVTTYGQTSSSKILAHRPVKQVLTCRCASAQSELAGAGTFQGQSGVGSRMPPGLSWFTGHYRNGVNIS